MSWTLSCGCKSEYGGFPSEWDGETRECEPCVNYGSLCEKCFLEYDARPAQYTHPVKQLSDGQYDRGFDDGCKHSRKIYEAEIEALKANFVKQLSDEEIANIWSEHTKVAGTYDVKDIVFPFARAIIKEITDA